MRYRNLGETGMRVSEISLGTWAFGGEWGTAEALRSAGYDLIFANHAIQRVP